MPRRPVFKIVKYNKSMFEHRKGYNLRYIQGGITTAREDTLGVFCFKTKKQAKNFLKTVTAYEKRILRVLPIGRGKTPKYICGYGGLLYFYSKKSCVSDMSSPPKGTICYPAVEVLRESENDANFVESLIV